MTVALSLLTAACSSDVRATATTARSTVPGQGGTQVSSETVVPAPTQAPTTIARDGASDDLSFVGALAGMQGVVAGFEPSDDFIARLATTPTGAAGLDDFSYAAETYDAVTIIALAVEKAQDDGIGYASEIPGITRDGEKCAAYAACKAIIDAGGDPDYDGISGKITMNDTGEPTEAGYVVYTFGADNRLEDGVDGRADTRRFLSTSTNRDADVAAVPIEGTRLGDGELHIGALLPTSGIFAALGPPEITGGELAIAEINAAGGVLGNPVTWTPEDSGDTSTDIASQSVEALLGQNVDAIVGAASSSITLSVIDRITAAGVVQFSPANMSDRLTDYPDRGLYFRVAPPDSLQGDLLASLLVDDGASSAFILAVDDAYGIRLAEVIRAGAVADGVDVVDVKIYDPTAADFDAEVDEMVAADPDAIVLVTFAEGSRILRTMVDNDIGPTDKLVYGVDANTGNQLGENFDKGD